MGKVQRGTETVKEESLGFGIFQVNPKANFGLVLVNSSYYRPAGQSDDNNLEFSGSNIFPQTII